jgi:hypothetical protein
MAAVSHSEWSHSDAGLTCLSPGRYCAEMKCSEDWESLLRNLDRQTLMDFFLWVGETSRIGSTGSSGEYMRQFSQLHTTVTGRYVDRNDYKELYKVGAARATR